MVDLPKTKPAAPPNFYENAAAMSGGSKKPGKSAASGTDQEFLNNVTKLLKVLDTLGQMKPKGKDITKYTQAAADSMQEALKQVYGEDSEDQTPGADASAGDSAGTGAGGSAAPTPGMPGTSAAA